MNNLGVTCVSWTYSTSVVELERTLLRKEVWKVQGHPSINKYSIGLREKLSLAHSVMDSNVDIRRAEDVRNTAEQTSATTLGVLRRL